MAPPSRRHRKECAPSHRLGAAGRPGVTLLELLFALVLLSVVSGGVFTLFYSNTYGSIISGDQSVAMYNVQTALRTITADLCSGSGFSTPTNTGGLRVTYASGSDVEYYQSGTTLYRLVASTGNPTSSAATGLVSGTGFSLTYLDNSMTAIAGPMDATKYGQAVAVDVTVTINLGHSAFGQVSRTTRVMLRNKTS
jgi:prepilin-type N-terminal cleavage/methylation domain-containing protein